MPPPPATSLPPSELPSAGGDDAPFRFRVDVPVRFRDIDVGAHAHHSHALAYFEEARFRYWTEVAGRPASAEAVDYILAEAHLRYRDRILYPSTLSVGVRTASIGRKHVELAYEIRRLGVAGGGDGGQGDEAGIVAVTGWTVLVLYDYREGRTAAVPDDLRSRLERFEGRALPRRPAR